MQKWTWVLLIVGGLAFLRGCDGEYPDYHYKITIYAEGKAFSSVRKVETKKIFSIVDSGGLTVRSKLTGEAVVMDLPSGRTVYALLNKPGNYEYSHFLVGKALGKHRKKLRWEEEKPGRPKHAPTLSQMAEGRRETIKVKGPRDLPRTQPTDNLSRPDRPPVELWPMFVYFTNPADRKSLKEIFPDSIGVERITIEITDEPVTTGIEKRIPEGPWVCAMVRDGKQLGVGLTLDSFKQGIKK